MKHLNLRTLEHRLRRVSCTCTSSPHKCSLTSSYSCSEQLGAGNLARVAYLSWPGWVHLQYFFNPIGKGPDRNQCPTSLLSWFPDAHEGNGSVLLFLTAEELLGRFLSPTTFVPFCVPQCRQSIINLATVAEMKYQNNISMISRMRLFCQ